MIRYERNKERFIKHLGLLRSENMLKQIEKFDISVCDSTIFIANHLQRGD